MNNVANAGVARRVPADIAALLVDPRAYTDDRIHNAYRWLRRNMPFAVAEPDGFDPFWVVTRHADVMNVGRNNAKFLSERRPLMLVNKAAEAFTRKATGGRTSSVRSMISTDAPDHMKLRLITQAWFAPKNLREIETKIAAIADESIEKMLSSGGRCDFVADVALHYPLRVIMSILGVPREDEPMMLKLTQEIFTPSDDDAVKEGFDPSRPTHEAEQKVAALKEMGDYFLRLTADRLANPRDDLATIIANASIHGRPLTAEEQIGYYAIIATAGHDTTSSSTAGAMWALASSPNLFDRIHSDVTRIPALIEEAVRFTTPIKTFMRGAAEDTIIADQPIRENDWIMLCYASANRDEAVFDSPDRFDIDRPNNNKQIAFGYGAHVCLGQHLARLEMKILFEKLIPRLQSVQADGDPVVSASFLVNGPKRAPIQFTPA